MSARSPHDREMITPAAAASGFHWRRYPRWLQSALADKTSLALAPGNPVGESGIPARRPCARGRCAREPCCRGGRFAFPPASSFPPPLPPPRQTAPSNWLFVVGGCGLLGLLGLDFVHFYGCQRVFSEDINDFSHRDYNQ